MLIAALVGGYLCTVVFACSFFARMDDEVVFGESVEYFLKGIIWPLIIPMSLVSRLGHKAADKLKAPKIPEAKLLT